ncbi:MAG: ATP-binding protein [Thiomargarita sp.]|nr:ATP-binding protein [Thiomargarita sp.]
MFLKKISIADFRVLKNIEIQFEKEFTPTIFPLGSLNGGGKSTLLQLVFTLLHCSFNKERHQYLVNLLSTLTLSKQDTTLAKFEICHDDKEFYLEFILADHPFFDDLLKKEHEEGNQKTTRERKQYYFKSKKMFYLMHLDNEKILLCKTNINDLYFLTKMSDKVYLAAPSTQIFLFLSDKEKKAVFLRESGVENYVNYINEAKKNLTGFFTYDFASTDLIIKSFENVRNKDFEDALEYGEYGNHFKTLKTALNRFLIDKTITVDKQLSSIIFKLKNDDEKLLPEDLSHGELKKLGIYIWLRYYAIEDSLVLMDEIEIGLHPDWQYEIVNELQEWSKNNQFLLATHSYELCQALTPSHVKELEPKLIKTK